MFHYLKMSSRPAAAVMAAAAMLLLSACDTFDSRSTAELETSEATADADTYLIGPGDLLEVFVWRNPELSVTVPVRPDGRISIPLVEDVQAIRRTPSELARTIEEQLKVYVQEPVVTVIVTGFVGPYSQQVRVVGEAAMPQAVPYREEMSLLDVVIAVGGLTQFAAGNRAVIARESDGGRREIPVNLDRLVRDGDLSANVSMRPGDVLIVPQSWF